MKSPLDKLINMKLEPVISRENTLSGTTLRVYLLGRLPYEEVYTFQRRLLYDVTGNRDLSSLILCQHDPIITVGRQGSFSHILCDYEELESRKWRVRWVNRGGGCQLHIPGQLAIYPVLPLDRMGLGLPDYIIKFQEVLLALLDDFSVKANAKTNRVGIWAGSRLIADIGIAVRDWVAYYGALLNINNALEPFQLVRCGGSEELPMTSLERERRSPLSPTLVRQRLIEHFVAKFGFERMALFTEHPDLQRKADSNAFASRT